MTASPQERQFCPKTGTAPDPDPDRGNRRQPRLLVSKVLQDAGFPDWYPVSSHFCRCADVPWLNCDESTCWPAMLVWM